MGNSAAGSSGKAEFGRTILTVEGFKLWSFGAYENRASLREQVRMSEPQQNLKLELALWGPLQWNQVRVHAGLITDKIVSCRGPSTDLNLACLPSLAVWEVSGSVEIPSFNSHWLCSCVSHGRSARNHKLLRRVRCSAV